MEFDQTQMDATAVSGEVKWSDLPRELWPAIGNRLLTSLDVLRFRSVCGNWRSSLPPFRHISPPFPLPLPSPITGLGFGSRNESLLFQTIIYRFENLFPTSSLSQSASSGAGVSGWLLKMEESEPGKMRLLHPLCKSQIRYNLDVFPKSLDLLNCRIVEFAKSYTLRHSSTSHVLGITKVVMLPDFAWTKLEDSVVLAIYQEGKLGFCRPGDDRWTRIDDRNFYYDDLIVYKSQFYVVDRWGTVSWIDSSFRLIQFSPPLCGFGSKKHLVESNGELYVIDRFLERDQRNFDQRDENPLGFALPHPLRRMGDYPAKAVDFKVYKLDQEWGRWVEVKNLGEESFVLGNDCSFSVSAREFCGCKGNCIYYTDMNDDEAAAGRGSKGCHSRVFDLEERRIGRIISLPGFSQIFWPPPTWLSSPHLVNLSGKS